MTACVVCGKKQPAELMVYSRWTGNHYCRDTSCGKPASSAAKRKKTG